MRRVLIGAVVLMVAVLTPTLASAQAQQGDKEILLNGQLSTINTDTGFGSSTFTFGQGVLNLGQYFSDTLEIGGGPSIFVSGGAGSTDAQFGANAFLRKYLHTSRPTVAPFVGAEAYDRDFSEFSDSLFVDVNVGVKNYLSERSALEVSAGFGLNPSHPGDQQILQIKVGLTVLFGR
jgi:hypothetical protein